MTNYQVKPYSNIAKIGLDKLEGTECSLDESSDSPDGILIRSTKLAEDHIKDGLKAMSRAGAGVNNIPIDLCTDKGIVVFNTPGANANAVKELVLAGLMLSSRNVFSSIDFVNNLEHLSEMEDLEPYLEENKKLFKGKELAGSTLGVVGLGAIGSKVAKMGVALEMAVIGYDPALSVKAAWKLPSEVIPAESPEELFKNSDYVTIHIPALDSTKGIINKDLLRHCKGVSLLNCARHEVVNIEDVLEILDSEKVEAHIAMPLNLVKKVSLKKTYAFNLNGKTVLGTLKRLSPMSLGGSNNRLAIFEFNTFFFCSSTITSLGDTNTKGLPLNISVTTTPVAFFGNSLFELSSLSKSLIEIFKLSIIILSFVSSSFFLFSALNS